MALFITVIGCGIHQDIPFIAISSEPGVRVSIDLGICHQPVGPFDQNDMIGCIEGFDFFFWTNVAIKAVDDRFSPGPICPHLG